MRVLIVGAGIGGLTTALILHRGGIDVTIVEAASEISEIGTGINLLPHGAGVLHELGLGPQLAAVALQTRAIEYRTQYGQLILRDPRGLHAGSPWPQYSIHRGKLQAVLLEKVRATLPPSAILVAHRFEQFENAADGVTAVLRRRADNLPVTIKADLLIGADGIHSTVCRQIHPDAAPLVFSGTMMWRGVVEAEPFLDGETMIIAGHHDTKTVVYPIEAPKGRSRADQLGGRDQHRPERFLSKGRLEPACKPRRIRCDFRGVPLLVSGYSQAAPRHRAHIRLSNGR